MREGKECVWSTALGLSALVCTFTVLYIILKRVCTTGTTAALVREGTMIGKVASRLSVGLAMRRKSERHNDALAELEAPQDLHFVTARMALDGVQVVEDVPGMVFKRWRPLLFYVLTLGMVAVQTLTAGVLIDTVGNLQGICVEEGDCGRGGWCTASPHPQARGGTAAKGHTPVGMCLECPPERLGVCNVDGSTVEHQPAVINTGKMFEAFGVHPKLLRPNRGKKRSGRSRQLQEAGRPPPGDGGPAQPSSTQDAPDKPSALASRGSATFPPAAPPMPGSDGSYQFTMEDYEWMCEWCVPRMAYISVGNDEGLETSSVSFINISAIGRNEWMCLIIVALATAFAFGEEARSMCKVLIYIHHHLPPDAAKVQELRAKFRPVTVVTDETEDAKAGFTLDTTFSSATPPPSPPAEDGVASVDPRDMTSIQVSVGGRHSTQSPRMYHLVKFMLLLLQAFRGVMLSLLFVCVPLFVLRDKSDAVSILLNTVAVLFVVELDNLAFSFGLSEISARSFSALRMRVTITDASWMQLATNAHMCSVLFAVLAVPTLANYRFFSSSTLIYIITITEWFVSLSCEFCFLPFFIYKQGRAAFAPVAGVVLRFVIAGGISWASVFIAFNGGRGTLFNYRGW